MVSIGLDHRGMEFGPTPYHRLLGDALAGDKRLFARGDQVDVAWQIVAPALEQPAPVQTYARGSWCPELGPESGQDPDPGESVDRG